MSDSAKYIGGGIGAVVLAIFGICAVCLGISLLIFIVCLPFAIHTVRYDEYGIKYYILLTTVSDEIYEPGRYFLGVGHNFITIPRTFQVVEFLSEGRSTSNADPLHCRTRDGLTVTLDISFQYRIARENVSEVFNRFALNYHQTVALFSRDTLREVASQYNAIEFFTNRTEIDREMESFLKVSVRRLSIDVEYFQLRKVDLPDTYEDIIEKNQIQLQNIPKAEFDQQSELIKADTGIISASRQAETIRINAFAQSEAIRITAAANANRTRTEITAFATAYKHVKSSLNLTAEDMISYVWVDTFKEFNSNKLIISLDRPQSFSFN